MRKKAKIIEKVKVKTQHHRGRFLADDAKKIAIKHAVPGDVVDIRVMRKRKCKEGNVLHTHYLSPDRVVPFCEHFGVCGGCKWQNISYEKQLEYKQSEVVNAFVGLTEDIENIIPCSDIKYYRNKVNFSFSNKKWLTNDEIGEEISHRDGLGFHVGGYFDKVVDIKHCYLQKEPSNKIRLAVRDYAREHNLSFCDCRTHEGLLRELVIRTTSQDEVMVILVVGDKQREKFYPLLHFLREKFPEISSLFYIVNDRQNNSSQGLDTHHFHGNQYITESLDGIQFKISPQSFFQTNIQQCLQIYRLILQLADFNGDETVYDLYTGVGSIALFLANYVSQVVGVEYVESAIENARNNATLNNIQNATFFAGNIQEVLNEDFVKKYGKPNVIVTDPAREGMQKKVARQILHIAPQKIIYVSCNPSSQAEDIHILQEGYDIKYVQPIDMFPHTHHIENVVLLTKK